ncbi:hypothetical protein DPEC_G00370970 [Dallia pectoralis]|nr:hypothetical protein DPEC_G00370970 [Dallia pectoralis]
MRSEDVFKEELGRMKGMEATNRVSAEATPKFYWPCSVPYAMRAKVEEELDRLLREDILAPVKHVEWATPIVPVLKPNGSRTMENLLQGLTRVAVYLDDIILTGRDEAEHLSTLDEEEAFQSSKQLLKSAKVLGHYTADKVLVLACDASPYGRPVPQMGSPRVQRWATLLRAYEYKIIYKPGQDHANPDALSRLPLPQTEDEEVTDQVLMLEVMEDPPITTKQVKQWTAKDVVLSQVLVWCHKGWPREVDASYKPYSQRKLELSVKDGCVLWGARLVIPQRGQRTY